MVSPSFPLELDHMYIWVEKDAPEAPVIASCGLQLFDRTVTHTGQGTASRFFMFKNMYLELIWVVDHEMLQALAGQVGVDFGPPSHWQASGASPFGIGLRYQPGMDQQEPFPFPTHDHSAEWMPPGAKIDIIPKTSIYEPQYFIVSDRLAYRTMEAESEHPLGLQRLTQTTLTVPNSADLGPTSQLLADHGVFAFRTGTPPLLELTFDHGCQQRVCDCRPTLPLIISY